MTLLYITYVDDTDRSSGSSVRPARMGAAFRSLGVQVVPVSGLQNRRRERTRTVRQTLAWLKTHRPDACYIEPPACPIYTAADRTLIRTLAAMKVPTAVFYRDAHWRYADWWGVRGPKAAALKAMHRRDLRLFETCCDRVYFPTATLRDLFADRAFRATGLLPPGCEQTAPPHAALHRRMIYVGGVSAAYGTDLLLAAFDRLQAAGTPVELTLCCRPGEWEAYRSGPNRPYLTVIHAAGDDLQAAYARCDAGLLPLRRDRYMDLALPVKLFEYWGAGLPVIATDCPEVAAMVGGTAAGLVCPATAEGIAGAVQTFYGDPAIAPRLAQNAAGAASRNRWVDRAAQVIADLTGEKLS